VRLAVKEHSTFLQLLAQGELETSVVIEATDDLLLKSGNCIPRGLAAALGLDLVKDKLIAAGQGVDYRVPGEVQSYREVAALLGCTLTPFVHWGDLGHGQWLLHTSMMGKPHCMGVLIAADGTAVVSCQNRHFKLDPHFGIFESSSATRHSATS